VRLANQAAVLTASRLANFTLLLLSPVMLVRLISVRQFGEYREFVLYASLLQSIAAFTIPDGLLYFIPKHPNSPWRVVRHSVALTAIASTAVVLGMIVLDFVMGGTLVGPFLLPLALYALFMVNLDFWEVFFIATRQTRLVVVYTAARLTSRMLVAVVSAWLSRDVTIIIWSLVWLEALRFAIAAVAWRRVDRGSSEPPVTDGLRDQWRFTASTGIAMLLGLARRNLATIAVVKMLGAEALARYSIGKYGEPIVATLRTSLSSVVLPEMVRREGQAGDAVMTLWRRSTVMCALLTFPIVPPVLRFAEPALGFVFGDAYRAAAVVMQIYMLVVIRECFDFSPALRSIGRTAPIVYGTMAGLVVAAIAVWVLVPQIGIAGAMAAYAIGSIVEAVWLAVSLMRLRGIGITRLADWGSIGKIVLAAALAALVLLPDFWERQMGVFGIALASGLFAAAYVAFAWIVRVPETTLLLRWIAARGKLSKT